MSRITLNSKCRLCRAEGSKLYLKGARCLGPNCPIEKKGAVPPGMHGLKRRRRPSDFGLQLRAKQKAKRIYGVAETQFKNYYKKAKKIKGLLGDNLFILLERRLDNLVYQGGLAQSRSQAKQFINHRHVLVNGKIVDVSSYSVKVGDLVSLDSKITTTKKDQLKINDKDFTTPDWLQVDKKALTVKVAALPTRDQIPADIDKNLIVKYYSR